MSEKFMPIMAISYAYRQEIDEIRSAGQPFAVLQIPWEMIAPHEAQAKTNHSQTLMRLAERGGLGACEALAILEDRAWRRMGKGEANAKLAAAVLAFTTPA